MRGRPDSFWPLLRDALAELHDPARLSRKASELVGVRAMTLAPVETHLRSALALERQASATRDSQLAILYLVQAQLQATFALVAAITERDGGMQ